MEYILRIPIGKQKNLKKTKKNTPKNLTFYRLSCLPDPTTNSETTKTDFFLICFDKSDFFDKEKTKYVAINEQDLRHDW